MISIRNLSEIECFITVAQLRSFSETAKKLHMSKNSVSRFIANLEDRLGEKILRRSTREVFLTVFGENFLIECQKFWNGLEKLESYLSHTKVEISGHLRILAANAFSAQFLYTKIKTFHQSHPQITTEIIFREGELWDLDAQDIHIVVGFPHVADITREWRHRKLGSVKQQLVISPNLLKNLKCPIEIEDLVKIPFITHSSRTPKNIISLSNGKKIITSCPILSANNFLHLKELCKNDLGALLITNELIEKEIENGTLRVILPDLPYNEFNLFVFCRTEEYSNPKIRAFMDCFN